MVTPGNAYERGLILRANRAPMKKEPFISSHHLLKDKGRLRERLNAMDHCGW
jgi:hypothetical protein